MTYIDLIEGVFDMFEKDKLTEKEIFEKCVNLVVRRNCDKEYMYTLNDTLYNRGYSFQFVVDNPKLAFDNVSYSGLTSNVTKSKAKTAALIDYLQQVRDHRLTLASLHMLKVKHLVDLDCLAADNETINANLGLTLDELFYGHYGDDSVRKAAIDALTKMGIPDAHNAYNEFRFDVEYLLWTIERDEANYGYLKVNTIKVALQMAPADYFVRNGKPYYYQNTSKESKKFVKLIDKDAIEKIKSKWGENGYETLHDGYIVLYKYFN